MKKRLLPLTVSLLALAGIAAALAFCAGVLTGRWPTARAAHQTAPVLVELDDAWADGLAAQPTAQGMKTYLAATLADVRAWGGTAVALTGTATDGSALFRDRTGALTTAPSVTATDKFLSRFDPVQELVRQAGEQGVEVLLLCGGADEPLTGWQTALAAKHGLRPLFAQTDAEGAVTGYALAADAPASPDAPAAADDARTAVLRADRSPGLLAAAEGPVCLGSYSNLTQDGSFAALYNLFTREITAETPDLTAALAGKTIARTLAVTYPTEDNSKVYTSRVFLMGTSDPAQPLTLNGAAVARGNALGVWGVLVELAEGENAFALQNGDASLTYTVRYVRTGGGLGVTLKNDNTKPAAAGQYLRVTDAIASALADPANSASIGQTLYRGATAQVVDSKRYSTGSKYTYAYQLATGDWVRSSVCALVDGSPAAFTADGTQVRYDSAARSTVLTFAGGTPAVYHQESADGLRLQLTFLSAGYEGALPALPEWITAAAVDSGADGFTLTLDFDPAEPLYGWAVNYDPDANCTELWLKRTPRLSGDPDAPLAGVVVMLDAGHGGSDDGAMGAAGTAAPLEKDLNLAAATAAKYRLEQLGATVLMTRSGDEFPTLGDRVTALNEQHPDYFIALHHNSLELTGDINQAWGVEAYWFYEKGDALGRALLEQVCAATGRQARQVKYGYYYVTRSAICPAVLLELGFVTNPTEYAECASQASLWADGAAVAEAIYRMVAANG